MTIEPIPIFWRQEILQGFVKLSQITKLIRQQAWCFLLTLSQLHWLVVFVSYQYRLSDMNRQYFLLPVFSPGFSLFLYENKNVYALFFPGWSWWKISSIWGLPWLQKSLLFFVIFCHTTGSLYRQYNSLIICYLLLSSNGYWSGLPSASDCPAVTSGESGRWAAPILGPWCCHDNDPFSNRSISALTLIVPTFIEAWA